MQPTPITEAETAILQAAAIALQSSKASIQEWKSALQSGSLYTAPCFLNYCALSTVGPRNDNNGARSRAERLKRRIEIELILPARLDLTPNVKPQG